MIFALAKENQEFIRRMLRGGRFKSQTEVVDEALRRMEREEDSYLNYLDRARPAPEEQEDNAPKAQEGPYEMEMAPDVLRSIPTAKRNREARSTARKSRRKK